LKKDYDILLRGHHLWLLYRFYVVVGKSCIRANMINDKYGKKHTTYVINTLERIVNSPELKIKIVAGISDEICKNCLRKEPICHTVTADLRAIAESGLRIGEVYTSKYILERLSNGG